MPWNGIPFGHLSNFEKSDEQKVAKHRTLEMNVFNF